MFSVIITVDNIFCYYKGLLLRLLRELYQDRVVSKESFDLWKTAEDDLKMGSKTMVVVILNMIFLFGHSDEGEEIT